MKLITIKFIKGENIYSPGEYVFKVGDAFEANVADILEDIRYSDPMKVVRVEPHLKEKNFHKGFKLQTLYKAALINRITETKMEKRDIQISLEEARNWYNGKDNTLKRLALRAYTEGELREPQTYSEVLDRLCISTLEVGIKITSNGKGEMREAMKLNSMMRVVEKKSRSPY